MSAIGPFSSFLKGMQHSSSSSWVQQAPALRLQWSPLCCRLNRVVIVVLAALRKDPELADIPVIMITIVDEHRRGIAIGAAGYLTKPIDRERLHRLVSRFRAS